MSDTAPPRFEAVTPILAVGDQAAALDFYERVLGFERGWVWGELASVCRGEVELNLDSSGQAPFGISRIYLRMQDVDGFHAAVLGRGANVTVPLADRPYGLRDFRLVDPWGNALSFGEVIAGEGGAQASAPD